MAQTTTTYLIRYVGDTKGLKQVQQQLARTNKVQGASVKEQDKLAKSSKSLGQNMARLAGRAAITIPIWLALRGAIMSVIGFVKDSIKTWIDLEREMGRVATVTRGSAAELDLLKNKVIDFSASSSRGFKEAASAMYALGSAGLSVTEQLTGMEHIMNVSIGTFGDTEQIAKLVAGAYNVFGKSMDEAYTSSAKFKRISDILSYTYSTQQVELSEIANAMTYVASIGSLMNIKFETLVGTIGVLNTGMLKGSKSGTALMNAFIRVAQKSDALAKLGVVFDPSASLDFLDVMTQLHIKYGDQALSLMNLKEIMDVFGRRGGRAAAQLIKDFDRWKKSLDDGKATFEDFAAQMKEDAENTLPMAFAKLGNSIKANVVGALSESSGELKDFINTINEITEEQRLAAEGKKYLRGPDRSSAKTEDPTNKSAWGVALELALRQIRGLNKENTAENVKQAKAHGGLIDAMKQANVLLEKKKKLTKEEIGFQKEMKSIGKELAESTKSSVDAEADARLRISKYIFNNANMLEMNQKLFNATVDILKDQLLIKKSELQVARELAKEDQKKIDKIKDSMQYEEMKLRGVKESTIERLKLDKMILEINEKIARANEKDGKLNLQNLDATSLMLGETEALEAAIQHVGEAGKTALLKTFTQAKKTIGELREEVAEFSDELKGSFQEGFVDLFKGDIGLAEFGDRIGETMREAILSQAAEGLTDLVFNMTGMGDLFGAQMLDIKGMFGGPAAQFEVAIIKASREGSAMYATAISNASVAGGSKIGTAWAGETFAGKSPLDAYAKAKGQGATDADALKASKGFQLPAGLQKGLGFGMAGLSGFMAGQAGGGGMAGGLMGGAGGILSMIPGMQGFGAALSFGAQLFGMFGKKETKVEEKRQTLQVTSRIDVTNHQLDIVNRNLVAMRQELTYIMQESFYFSEKRGTLEDNFSLDSRR